MRKTKKITTDKQTVINMIKLFLLLPPIISAVYIMANYYFTNTKDDAIENYYNDYEKGEKDND